MVRPPVKRTKRQEYSVLFGEEQLYLSLSHRAHLQPLALLALKVAAVAEIAAEMLAARATAGVEGPNKLSFKRPQRCASIFSEPIKF